MNKTQIKILFKKILPISILMIIIVGALIAIPIIRYSGEKMAKENDEWYSNPENREKIENTLNKYQKKEIKNNTNEIQQDKNIKYVKSLRIDIEGWKIVSKPIENNDEVGMLQLTMGVDYFNILFRTINDFNELEDYTEYQSQKIIKNLGKAGISLKLRKKYERIIKERLFFVEVYKSEFNNEKQSEMVIMSTRHNDYYFTLSYLVGSQNVVKLFESISFVD
ncbi:hypothetical protein [uncultured Algibacter sp.]|uniref:hypothetical protein n=1 Tax=uncultured Algibacter sp. TaxID=298659 RepID=UPI00260C6EB0|nr:hypothetical protein [uncultured Algibacter sp.]